MSKTPSLVSKPNLTRVAHREGPEGTGRWVGLFAWDGPVFDPLRVWKLGTRSYPPSDLGVQFEFGFIRARLSLFSSSQDRWAGAWDRDT